MIYSPAAMRHVVTVYVGEEGHTVEIRSARRIESYVVDHFEVTTWWTAGREREASQNVTLYTAARNGKQGKLYLYEISKVPAWLTGAIAIATPVDVTVRAREVAS